ncbi:MAG: ABC transporter ATP-binding protein, partial [Chloroflexota bacterium]
GRDQDQLTQFDENNRRLASLSIRQAMTGRGFLVVVQTFFTMAPAIVWLLGGLFISEGRYDITLGDIVAFTTIQTRLL